jgi:hypothetical protein
MRALYIIGIVLSVVFMFVSGFMIEEVSNERYDYYMYDYSTNYSYAPSGESTFIAGLFSLLFFVYFITVYIAGLVKIKRTTNKVLSIIGLSLTGILLLWNLLMMAEPTSLSFDEIGPVWILYCLPTLAFMIVGLVQAIRSMKPAQSMQNTAGQVPKSDLLDS